MRNQLHFFDMREINLVWWGGESDMHVSSPASRLLARLVLCAKVSMFVLMVYVFFTDSDN